MSKGTPEEAGDNLKDALTNYTGPTRTVPDKLFVMCTRHASRHPLATVVPPGTHLSSRPQLIALFKHVRAHL